MSVIPEQLVNLINIVEVSNWDQITELIKPYPAQHILLTTNAPNNCLILASKIFDLMSVSLRNFHLFKVMSDIYDPERNHGLYTHNNQIFYMDMKRVRYDDYKYMLRVLESVIYSHRIDDMSKIVVLFNNFDLVLNQYLHKFIKYADTLSASTLFIYVGTGLINFYASSTKLNGLCVSKKCYFKKLSCNNNLFV